MITMQLYTWAIVKLMPKLTRQQPVLKDELKKQLAKAFHVITLMPHTFSSGKRT